MRGISHYFEKSTQKWIISIYWEHSRYYIRRDPFLLLPFYTEEHAKKVRAAIEIEIKKGEFNPKFWMPDSPMAIRVYSLEEWLPVKSASKKTLQDYQSYFKNHVIPYFGDKDIRRTRANDVIKFRDHLTAKGLGAKTVYNVMAALKTMFRDAWRNEDIPKTPPFPPMSIPLPDEIEYLKMEQQSTILGCIPERDRPIFEIGMEYGLRVGEVRAIQKDCLTDKELIIKRAFSDNDLMETTKTKVTRRYELTDYAKGVLGLIPAHLGPYVFVRWDGKPYTNKNLNEIWKAAALESGINIKLYNAFRHSLGCQLLDMGASMDEVRDMLGHQNESMTRRYAKRNPAGKKSLLEQRRNVILLKRKGE